MISMCRKFLFKYKGYYFQYVLLAVLSWLASIVIPYLSGLYIDKLIEIHKPTMVFFYTKLILAIGIVACISNYGKSIAYQKIHSRTSNDICLFLIDHIRKLPLSFFKNKSSVYIIRKITTDCDQLVNFSVNEGMNFFTKVLTFVTTFIIMFSFNVRISSFLLVIIPVYIIIYKKFSKQFYDLRKNFIEKENHFISKLNQQINSILFIKLNSLYEMMHEKIVIIFEDFFSHIMKFIRTNTLYDSINEGIGYLAKTILFLYGGIEIYRGNLSVGEFTIMNVFFTMAFSSIQYLVKFGAKYQIALVSYNRIIEVLNTPEEMNGDQVLTEINEIQFKNLSFSYNKKKMIVDNFTYRLKKGNIYCIKGYNGSGKSTLIKMLLGIEQGYTGKILINNVELKNLNMYDLRKNLIGISEQEPTLFNETLKQNILQNNNQYIDDDKIMKYCEKLGLQEFIYSLPEGFLTIVDENNLNISGGEKQKISILRTLLKQIDLIIFDEPSSALDIQSVQKFKEILEEEKENKIIIIISHEEELLDIGDEIIRMGEK